MDRHRSVARSFVAPLARSLLSSQLSRKNGETINYRVAAAAAMESDGRRDGGGREAGKEGNREVKCARSWSPCEKLQPECEEVA